MNPSNIGSKTAKDGFKNEDKIVEKFNLWETDPEAREWLIIMGYKLEEIESVEAVKIHGYKTDVQVQVLIKLKKAIDIQNLQVKLVSNSRGFNQIDKRWVDKYAELWNLPENIARLLKLYTGEIKPSSKNNSRNKKRLFADEFSHYEQHLLLEWLKENKSLIVSDILKGRGKFAAEWMLVAQKINYNARWTLKPMNFCLNFFGNGEVIITPRGSFKIGRITMQRKGGDAGRPTANMLQFKINPAELFYV